MMPPRRRATDRRSPLLMTLGAALLVFGAAYIYRHGEWGKHDYGAITILVLGALLVDPNQVSGTVARWIAAWRGTKPPEEGA